MQPELSRDSVLKAFAKFDRALRGSKRWKGWEDRKPHKYAIEHEGKWYPVEQIASMASGVPVSQFSGGGNPRHANALVKACGVSVVQLHPGGPGNPDWARNELITRNFLYAALLLFIAGLVSPAVNLHPWAPGMKVFLLSFLGTWAGGAGASNVFLACLMGATANILMLVTAGRLLLGQKQLCFASAVAALGLTLLVQLPLNGHTNEGLGGLSFGYWFWAGSAGALSLAAWKRHKAFKAVQ